MFQSNEYELGMSPYSISEESLQQNLDRLDEYLGWLTKKYQAEFIGLSDNIVTGMKKET